LPEAEVGVGAQELDGDSSGEVIEALGVPESTVVELVVPARAARAAWEVAAGLVAAGLLWRAQATPARPTSPTKRATTVSLATDRS
jgi:hypothetical protein